MIIGRMKKFMSEVTLLGQSFVMNPDLTVEAAAKAVSPKGQRRWRRLAPPPQISHADAWAIVAESELPLWE